MRSLLKFRNTLALLPYLVPYYCYSKLTSYLSYHLDLAPSSSLLRNQAQTEGGLLVHVVQQRPFIPLLGVFCPFAKGCNSINC